MVKAHDVVTIEIESDSDLARALATAGKTPIAIVSNGQRYIVSREPFHAVDDYDPDEFREALRRAADIFTPEEAEQLKKDIYRWREEGSRPMNRPRGTCSTPTGSSMSQAAGVMQRTPLRGYVRTA
jgi:hypothetical protein